MSPGNETWTEGWLPDGTHFHIDRDPYGGGGVLRINGEEAEFVDKRAGLHGIPVGSVSRLRDGGTTTIKTTRGTFTAHRSMRLRDAGEVYDSWEGQRLLADEPCAFGPEGEHHGGELVPCAVCGRPTCDFCGVNEGDDPDGDWLCPDHSDQPAT